MRVNGAHGSMVAGSGMASDHRQHSARPSTNRPKPSMHADLSKAARAPSQGRRQHRQRYGVVGGIAGKIDRIGQQRQGARAEPGRHLGQEHEPMGHQRNPYDAPVAWQVGKLARSGRCVVVVVMVIRHGMFQC